METVKRIAEESIVKDEEDREQTKENKELQMHENGEKEEREPKTGVSFPRQAEGKQLMSIGLRRKKVLALHINVYAFGIYADDVKLREILKSKFKAPTKPATKDIFEAVIDADAGIMVRLVIVFGMLSMSMVRKNFDEGIGASLKKLNGGKTDKELVSKIMGSATDNIKLPSGSVIEISRLPGYVLQTKVKGEVISVVESELLCRAYFHLYLGDDPFDKEAKDKFGCSLFSLF